MDFVKKAASSLGNKDEKKQDSNNNQGGDNQQKDDYVDKAFGYAAGKSGQNIDRNTQEKITDGGRSAYEKATGTKVSDKISN